MALLEDLLQSLEHGRILKVLVGLHWTAVVAEREGERCCGLSSTLTSAHEYHGIADVPGAGALVTIPAHELAAFAHDSARPIQASIGVAAINALLPKLTDDTCVEANAEQVIVKHGEGKTVAIVGDFPFMSRLRSQVKELFILDHRPREGILPAEAAPDILPRAEFVAITGMAFVNHSLEALLSLCADDALVMVLGPSTPLSPILFDHGVDFISGSQVVRINPVLEAISQGANFRQVHRAGVRLVTAERGAFAQASSDP
jgi:uncharacterized protein (DUF4213/DUF364 family)